MEYLLLLSSTMMVALVVGTLFKKQASALADRVLTAVANAVMTVVFG